MKHFSTILILILSLRFASAAYDSGYDFHHFIASSDGLSFDDVKCIVQDTRSNIWAGTRYGLNRYDGTAFKTYFKNDMGVLSDFIRCLYAAPDGNVWIGTSSGLAMYDSHRDVFVNPLKEAKEQIMCIVPDYTGNLWFGEEDGVLLKRNGKNGEFKKYDFAQIVRSTSLVRMAINRKNELYICAYCDNIYYFDSATETLIPVDLGNYSDFFKGDDVGGIVFSHSSNDIAYVLGKRSGLCEVDLRKRTVKILYTSGSNQKVYRMSGKTDLSSFNIEDRDSEFLSNLESVVMHNICDEAFSVKQLETELCMSHTALYKKMIGLLNTSPVEYIKTKRLSLAAQLIRQNGAMISEVCYKVGFTSPSYFTKCFRETIGMTPSEYARKYSHQQ